MIVIDTSALVAIALGEPERDQLLAVVLSTDRVLVALPAVVEARLVVHSRRGQAGVALLDDFLRLPVFEVAPSGLPEADAAYAAFVLYGRGSGHPARLNFGDLFSYALAKVKSLPLLYKGRDFASTDIESALPPAPPDEV